ncbi:MAG: DUF2721 domain-containing protein [Vampirovibrionales bacterium]
MQITVPALLFSAVTLMMLAYTNRFHALAILVRDLHEKVLKEGKHPSKQADTLAQIRNFKTRIHLIKNNQLCGVIALGFCVLSMFMIGIHQESTAEVMFGVALALIFVSYILAAREITLSTSALDVELSDIQEHL